MTHHRNFTIGCLSSFFTMFLVVVPIIVPFWRSLGLTMQEILEIQGLFGLSVALFEVPTGYVADLFSRKVSVCVGTFIAACGFTMIPFCTTYETILLYEVVLALGVSFVSGADISLVYDSIKDHPNRLKLVGSLNTWGLVGEAFAGILASVLVLWSFSPVLWAQVIAGWAPFILSFWYIEPAYQRMSQSSHFANFSGVLRHLLFNEQITRRIFINSLVWSLSTFSIVWLLQPYWLERGVPLVYLGALWSAMMFIAAGSSKITHAMEKKWGAPSILVTIALSSVVAYFTMAASTTWIGIVAGGLFYVSRGFAGVIFTDAYNWKIPSEFRATANSLRSLCFRLSYVVIGPVTGLLIDSRGIPFTLVALGATFLVLFFVFMVPLCRQIHGLNVDYIAAE